MDITKRPITGTKSKYYLSYYQGNRRKSSKPGVSTSFAMKDAERDRQYKTTEKQRKLYADLIAFAKDSGIDTTIFKLNRRTNDEYPAKINGLYSILNRRGLIEKWKSKKQICEEGE